METLHNLTLEELQTRLDKALDMCEVYKGTKDGSYEMAKHSTGVYTLQQEIKERG